MPEVPTLVPSPLEGGENLDLHEVPTKAPIAFNVVADDGQDAQPGYLRERKGLGSLCLSRDFVLQVHGHGGIFSCLKKTCTYGSIFSFDLKISDPSYLYLDIHRLSFRDLYEF